MARKMKIVLIGESGVGKSCLLTRFTANDYRNMTSTILLDLKNKVMRVDGREIDVDFWDTAGSDRYRALAASHYRGANGAILVYDVTSRSSYDALDYWRQQLSQYTDQSTVCILVGNKMDRAERQVPEEDGHNYAKKHGMLFLEASASTASNVDHVFQRVVERVARSSASWAWGNVTDVQLGIRPRAARQEESCC